MRLLIITLLTLCGTAHAVTVQGLLDALNAKTGVVLSAWIDVTPAVMPRSDLHLGTIAWVEIADGAVTKQTKDIIIKDLGDVVEGVNIEQAYWVGGVPGPLRPEGKFLSARTTGGWAGLTRAAQLAAIQSFCNSVYKGAVAGARDIREFQCEAVDGNTVKVSGYFNTGASLAEWQRQTWFVKLLDANGSVAAPYSNIEFQRVVETASANQANASVDTEANEAFAMNEYTKQSAWYDALYQRPSSESSEAAWDECFSTIEASEPSTVAVPYPSIDDERSEELQITEPRDYAAEAAELARVYMPGIDPYGHEEHEPRQLTMHGESEYKRKPLPRWMVRARVEKAQVAAVTGE